jgi:acyl-CoA synthetase (AMP-forming)/AMP-acid ligase II
MNFGAHIELNRRNSSTETAFYYKNDGYTWKNLDKKSNQFANLLQSHGLSTADELGILAPNVPEFVIAFYGAMKAGVVAMPLNIQMDSHGIITLIGDMGLDAVFVTGGDAEKLENVDLDPVEHIYIADGPLIESTRASVHRFEEVIREQETTFRLEPQLEDDNCFYMHTGGTTGDPKPVIATHGAIRTHALGTEDNLGLSQEDVALTVAPLFHDAGLNFHLTTCTHLGASQVLVDGWDAQRVLTAIEQHEVTYFAGVPTMLYDLLQYHDEHGAEYDTSSLEVLAIGGQNVPPSLISEYEKKYDGHVLEGYGLTETMPNVVQNSPTERKLGTAGQCLKNVADIKIVSLEDWQQEMDTGNIGELLVSGDVVTPGYVGRPELTEKVFETDTDGDRWLRTGDLARIDEDGYITIVNRVDDMIISGGNNIYPSEVEQALLEVVSVKEAVVIGESDDRLGERVVAVVVVDNSVTEQDILDSLADTGNLAEFKRPHRIVQVDEFPRAGSGKIDRSTVERKYI